MARTKNPSGKNASSKTLKETTGANGTPAVPGAVEAAAMQTAAQPVEPAARTSNTVKTTAAKAKTESRGNGSRTLLEEEIRRRAYELYAQRGYSSGSETDDWLVAEREVLQRHHQQGA